MKSVFLAAAGAIEGASMVKQSARVCRLSASAFRVSLATVLSCTMVALRCVTSPEGEPSSAGRGA